MIIDQREVQYGTNTQCFDALAKIIAYIAIKHPEVSVDLMCNLEGERGAKIQTGCPLLADCERIDTAMDKDGHYSKLFEAIINASGDLSADQFYRVIQWHSE